MSVYFLIKTERQPSGLNITDNLRLEILSKNLLPKFFTDAGKSYFYFLDGELNYRLISEPKNGASMDEVFNYKFQTERNEKFKAVLQWISAEVRAGNRVSVIRQIETANDEECEEYNSVYETKSISLESISKLCTDIAFDFNTEYIFE